MAEENLQSSEMQDQDKKPTGEPVIHVGIMDERSAIEFSLNGQYYLAGHGPLTGKFTARPSSCAVSIADDTGREIACSSDILLTARDDASFTLFGVTIGNRFHWEREENQTFQGSLLLRVRSSGTLAAINIIPLEDYLQSVISSEMSGNASEEFLKAHAIMSRSWLLSALDRKRRPGKGQSGPLQSMESGGEIVRWYEQEDHDLYDVCADDHCQRYQGITRIVSSRAGDAVLRTRGQVLKHGDEICDARFSKACGGLTENFATAWEPKEIPYLTSISDSTTAHKAITTEEEATRWITSEPDANCNTKDENILNTVLPGFDRETTAFFRWKVEYGREELEEIIRDKSGFDFGTLIEIKPLSRGPSGRIFRLSIRGSKKSMIVGKELEIRRWLSRSHLYSSAFLVNTEYGADKEVEKFIFHGAGWGHGVGLCQIGAAVMAEKGFKAEEILKHYFTSTRIEKIY